MNIKQYMKNEDGAWKWWMFLIIALIILRLGNTVYMYFYQKRQAIRISMMKEHMMAIGLGKNASSAQPITESMSEIKPYTEIDMLYEIQMGLVEFKNKMLAFIF